ncbi:MAG: hypothetical protein HKN43_00945 [Rhodothermales bacterium]|nr:hypothetical protein [Rhodothermales bacterium]
MWFTVRAFPVAIFLFLFASAVHAQGEVDSLYSQAVQAHDSGEFERAIALYSDVIELDANHANAYWNRANLWPDEQNARALEDYKQVARLAPDFDAAFGNYGFTLLLENRLMDARKASLKAYRLDNTVYSWPLNIGHTYMLEGKPDSARIYYRWAIFRMESREDLDGAVSDFDTFIERGWKPETSSAMRIWMMKSYEGRD